MRPAPGVGGREGTVVVAQVAWQGRGLERDEHGGRSRREVEAQLRRALAVQNAPAGYIGDWLLLASSVLLFLLLSGMGVLLLVRYLRP